jgi:hypothetical protein
MKVQIIRKGVYILFVIILCSCSREPEFIELEMASLVSAHRLLQFFVIGNMPEDPHDLILSIAEFNKDTIDIPNMLQKKYKGCYRQFFKKTYKSMQAFKEPNPDRAWGSITNNSVIYATYFDFNEEGVIKVIYRGSGNPAWEIENPIDEEIFYPWLRE